MAGVTGDLKFAFEVAFVDGQFHKDHLARRCLFSFVVLVRLTLDVAELALHSQRNRDKLHEGNALLPRDILQHLNVLVFGASTAALEASCAKTFTMGQPGSVRARVAAAKSQTLLSLFS